MDGGLVFSCDYLQGSVKGDFSYTRNDTSFGPIADASLISYYTPDNLTVSTGIEVLCHTELLTTDPGHPLGQAYVSLSIPDLSISSIKSYTSWQNTLSGRIKLIKFKIYSYPGLLECRFSGWEFYVGGSLYSSGGAFTIQNDEFTPSGIPLLGIPFELSCVASDQHAFAIGSFTANTFTELHTIETDTTVVGGWTFAVSGVEYALPVNLSTLAVPTMTCNCEPDDVPEITCTSTASGQISAHYDATQQTLYLGQVSCTDCGSGVVAHTPAVYDVYQTTREANQTSSQVTLMPDLEKSVGRFNTDYAAVIFRSAFPRTSRSAYTSCGKAGEGLAIVNTVRDYPHPAQSQFLGVVGDTVHSMEDTFGYESLTPYSQGSSRYTGFAYASSIVSAGSCSALGGGEGPASVINCAPASGGTCYALKGSTFDGVYFADTTTSQQIPYLRHSDRLVRYNNFWVNPHWGFFYYFPYDGTTGTNSWKLDGSDEDPSVYWIPLRSQWLSNSLLPTNEDRKTRTDLISAGLYESGFNSFMNTSIFGQYTSWWGISRFDCELIPNRTVSFTRSISGNISSIGGSLVFNTSNFTVTPVSASVTIDFNLCSFDRYPYQLPNVGYRWGLSATSNFTASMIGYDSQSSTLIDNGSVFDWPSPVAVDKYAGSWGQDLSLGETTDTGIDTKAQGISSTLMGQKETVHHLQLLQLYSASTLRYSFSNTIIGSAFSVDYPVLYQQSDPKVIFENGQMASIIRNCSSGFRWGQWNFWDYTFDTWLDTPTLLGIGSKTTTLDWLGYRNILLYGTPAASGVDEALSSRYDSVEGQSRIKAAYDTVSFVTTASGQIAGICDNTLREIPPLACFPRKDRDIAYKEVGEWVQKSYSCAHEPRYLVNRYGADIYDPSMTKITALASLSVSGWSIVSHKSPVTNSEDVSYFVSTSTASGDILARVSPWHGYFGSIAGTRSIESLPFILETYLGNVYRSYTV